MGLKKDKMKSDGSIENLELSQKWIVHKFGGSSVGGVDQFRKVLSIVLKDPASKMAVVVSAMAGVTDKLIRASSLAAEQNSESGQILDWLSQHHSSTVKELLTPELSEEFMTLLQNDVKDLKEILRGVWLSRHIHESTLEVVSGYGELWSSRILVRLLSSAWQKDFPEKARLLSWVDARTVLTVDPGELGPQVDWDLSESQLNNLISKNSAHYLVITGFIASTRKGVPTTLKRNGSDFSASIFGRLLKAREIVIWTDVDGVYSADPRKVPEAQLLREISFEEAIELAYFGAKVIHPYTMGPAVALNIPILIKNTFRPEVSGTYIHKVTKHNDGLTARGFTTIDHVAMINVEGTGMMGVPGIAQRLFGALREVNVSVILISQASSEHSICFAVPIAQSETAKIAVEKTFFSEISHGQIERIEVVLACSILAMVGDGMVEKRGVAGKFFGALGKASVNIRAIAQGSSERNISVVIDQKDAIRGLRSTHSAFFLSDYTISIGIIGPGQIGKALLRQITSQREFLREKFKVDLRVRGITNSAKMSLTVDGQNSLPWNDQDWAKHAETSNLEKFTQHIKSEHIPHSVIIDCSASEGISDHYLSWMNDGIHIITPNKKAGSGLWSRIQKIKECENKTGTQFLYEATVGAGLPVISTLRDLLRSGDELISIEGILSGTLSYVFGSLGGQKPFSETVLEAKAKGYTEPDPRDDLSGIDFARKIVILAREAGQAIELEDVQIDSLVPKNLLSPLSTEDFVGRISEMDGPMGERIKAAQKKEKALRFIGSFSPKDGAQILLRELNSNHPFLRLNGTDNIIAFKTKRYSENPLIVQGPGAGPEVTAAGIFADLLRLARTLGAVT